jgi:anaerobic glycerol-3-phosphate dehydrogenase
MDKKVIIGLVAAGVLVVGGGVAGIVSGVKLSKKIKASGLGVREYLAAEKEAHKAHKEGSVGIAATA